MIILLKDRKGSMAVQAVIVLLVLLLIFSAISEYLRLFIIAKGIRDELQTAVISVVTQNYDEVYTGLREGYSGGYVLNGDRWTGRVDQGKVMEELDHNLGSTNGMKSVHGSVEYELSDLRIDILNAPLAPTSNNERFESEVYVTLTVPLAFGWDHIPPMVMRLKVKAGYTPKF